MLKDRSELEQHLLVVLDDLKYRRINLEKINRYLIQFDISSGFVNEILKNKDLITEVETSILCLLSIISFEISGSPMIRPQDYFTPKELEEVKKYKKEKDHEIELPIVIPEVVQIDPQNYVSKIAVSELVNWYNAQIIEYDFDSQRSPKYKKGTDGIIPVPDINTESVKDIEKEMVEGTYLPDTIRINVYSEEVDPLTFNPKNRTLTINDGARVTILDGFHRSQGGIRAVLLNPDLDLTLELSIKSYDPDTAKRYFGQINTVNVVKTERLNELKQEKISYVTVKYLQLHSDLKGKIGSGSTVNQLAGQLTSVDIMANAIEAVFEPKTSFEAQQLGIYLKEFFEYLFGYFGEKINDKENVLSHPKIFIGYIVIAKHFRDAGIPLEEVKTIESTYNLSKDNKQLIDELASTKGLTNSRGQRQIRKYFEELVK